MKNTYFIRVDENEDKKLISFLEKQTEQFHRLTADFTPAGLSFLYSAVLDSQDELSLKLTVPIIGCMKMF
jgi:hypothetical protein